MKIYYLYSLFIILNLTSCVNESVNSITLEKDNITIWIGQEDSVSILSENKPLLVESDDEKIASASIKNNAVIIKAHEKSGKTILHVKDVLKNEATIVVYTQTLYGAWKISETPQYKIEVIITAEDITVKESLKKFLWESKVKSLNTTYGFYADTKKLEIITPDTKKTGDFLFNNNELIITYENVIESYDIKFVGLNFIQLTQDLTENYKNIFPNAGIEKVLINSYLSYISF